MDPSSHHQQVAMLQAFANAALGRYELPAAAQARMVNLSENATFCIEDRSGPRWALRVHRQGYHSRAAIVSELAWLMALRSGDVVITPRPIEGRDGELIQMITNPAGQRHVVLFEWESGVEPAENDVRAFELLGATTARMHGHARRWTRPPGFNDIRGTLRPALVQLRTGAPGATGWE